MYTHISIHIYIYIYRGEVGSYRKARSGVAGARKSGACLYICIYIYIYIHLFIHFIYIYTYIYSYIWRGLLSSQSKRLP